MMIPIYKDKKVSRSCYLHNGNPMPEKAVIPLKQPSGPCEF